MNSASEAHVATLLQRAREGDAAASDQVITVLYLELHEIASALIGRRPSGLTLQATALVHEAWLKLKRGQASRIADSNHFLSLAARAMRCVLVDHARTRVRREASACRDATVEALDQVVLAYEEHAFDLEALDLALDRLAGFDPRMARAVELRFFAGMDCKATAEAVGLPLRTFDRDWLATKTWLRRQMK